MASKTRERPAQVARLLDSRGQTYAEEAGIKLAAALIRASLGNAKEKDGR